MSGFRSEVARRLAAAEVALAAASDGDPRLEATVELGRLAAGAGEARAVGLLLAAVDLADALARPVLSRAALVALGRALVAQGDVALGRGNLERGLGEAQRAGDPAAPQHAADAALGLVEAWLAEDDQQRAQAALSTVPAGLPQRDFGQALLAQAREDLAAATEALARAEQACASTNSLTAILLGARCEALSVELATPSLEARLERLSAEGLRKTLQAILEVSEAPQVDPWSATADAVRRLQGATAVELEADGVRVTSPPGATTRPERSLSAGALRVGIAGGHADPNRDLACELLLQVAGRLAGSAGTSERVLDMLDRLLESDLEGPQLFELAVQLAQQATGATRGRLLRVSADASSSLEVGGDASFVSRSLLRHVVLTGRPLLLEDASESPPAAAGESVGAKGLRSVVAAPLFGKRGRVLGVLYLDDPGTAGRFGAAEAAVAVQFAARLGGLLEDDLRAQLRASGQPAAGAAWIPPKLLEPVRGADAPVLVSGESGVGKEHFARAAHAGSARAAGPFVVVSCGTIADELLESELFGHEQGAFTGAHARREGVFQRAQGGVLFFDGLQDASPRLQAEVLRAVESGEVRPLGGEVERVDVRVIASYSGDPARGVSQGRLRQDLYYRLSVLHVTLPPLRERKAELPQLIESVLEQLGAGGRELSAKVLARLQAYSWPGNLRELQATLERALIDAGNGALKASHLQFKAPLRTESDGSPLRLNPRQLHVVETLAPGELLRNADHAAAWGISPATAWRDLVGLAKAGLLQAEGKGRGAGYRATARAGRPPQP